ncbi:hypothetical protein FI667_g11267, partial [Globisporangium splendens]
MDNGAEFDAVRAFLSEFDAPRGLGDAAAVRGGGNSAQQQQQQQQEAGRSILDELVAVQGEALSGAAISSQGTETVFVTEPLETSTLVTTISSVSAITTTRAGKLATVKKPPKSNSNKARDARRDELIYLRRKVTELERQLSFIQKNTTSERSEGKTDTSVPDTLLRRRPEQLQWSDDAGALQSAGHNGHQYLPSKSPPTWKNVAAYQQEERTRSERENIRLKLLLENQLKIARSLESFLVKKIRPKKGLEKVYQDQMEHKHHVDPPAPNLSDAAIFDDLLAGVESSYSEVDTIFEASKVVKQEVSSPIDAQMETDHLGNAVCVKVFVNKLLPFDLHATGTAVWHHYVFAKDRLPNRIHNHSVRRNVDTAQDTIVENYNVAIKLSHKSAHYNVKQVLRRYVEEERIVVLWKALYDQTQLDDEHVSGVKFLEKGFIVMKRPQTHSPSVNETYTLLQTCYAETPVLTGTVATLDPMKIHAIIDFAINATATNLACSHQMIENVLLEQATKKMEDCCL